MADNEPNYELPTSQVDLEARQANGNASTRVLSTSDEYAKRQSVGTEVEGRDFSVEGNDTSAYVGVDPVYQNYASETEQPLRSEEGPEAELEKALLDGDTVPGEPVKEEGDAQDNEASEAPKPPVAKRAAPRHSSSS